MPSPLLAADGESPVDRVAIELDRSGLVRTVTDAATGRLAGAVAAGTSFVEQVDPSDRAFVAANLGWAAAEAGRTGRIAFRLARPNRGWTGVLGVFRNRGSGVELVLELDEVRLARRAAAQMRRVVEGSLQGIVVRTKDEILYLNDGFARLVGYDVKGDIYRLDQSALDKFIHPEDRPLVLERIKARTTGTEAVSHYEIRLMRKNGEPIWVAVAATSIVWDGKPASLSWLTDIDARKRTEIEVRRSKQAAEFANRSKTEFLAHMSHELRTPLNAIMGFSQMIANRQFGPIGSPKYVEYANDIHKSGCHLLDLINDVLDLSKIEAGRLELRESWVALPVLIEECVSLLRPRAEEAEVALRAELPPGLPQLRADARAIRQVLANLLSNAVKFTPAGGTVVVAARVRAGRGIEFSVADTGIGMSPSEIDIAFAPFGQIDSPLARRHAGTGLGLPLSRSLIRLHGGEIGVVSSKGVGTTVTVSLPEERVAAAVSAPDGSAIGKRPQPAGTPASPKSQ